MSSYVLSDHGELLVAAHAVDERAITRALKQFDDRLILALNEDPETRQHVWQILVRYGGDRPAHTLFSWTDRDGRPLPLSSGIIEEVRRLHVTDTFAGTVAHNRLLRATSDRDDLAEATAIAEDILPRLKDRTLACLHRGIHLRRSRHKPGGLWNR